MERSNRRDLPTVIAGVIAMLVFGGVVYFAVDAATMDATFDTNSPNGTTQGPPASFESR